MGESFQDTFRVGKPAEKCGPVIPAGRVRGEYERGGLHQQLEEGVGGGSGRAVAAGPAEGRLQRPCWRAACSCQEEVAHDSGSGSEVLSMMGNMRKHEAEP